VSDLLRILAVFALVGANAFFVIGEYAVVTARRTALRSRAEAGSGGARVALRLMDDPVRVISTVQVAITAIGILTGAIGEPLVRDLLGGGLAPWLSFVIAFAIVTYLSVVLGELVPKALTLARAEALAVLVARPIELFAIALRPAVWVLRGSARGLLRPFGIGEVVAGETIRSAEELRAVVDEAEGSGVIPRAQEELLHNVFDFADREAGDIMVPAPDVAWLDASLTPAAALDRVVETPHERYPVGRGSIHDLIGVVHVRDLVAADRERPDTSVGALARPALVVPATKDLGALLREQREARQQLAVIADEYGATVGVVSIEDVLEEIVGEIEDEYDLPDARLTWIDEHTVRVAGSMTIDDFNETVGTSLPQRGPRTLAGLAFDALGRRPRPGDAVPVGDTELRVEDVQGPRITSLRIVLPARDPTPPEPVPEAADAAPEQPRGA
jgi:putative hemolysin